MGTAAGVMPRRGTSRSPNMGLPSNRRSTEARTGSFMPSRLRHGLGSFRVEPRGATNRLQRDTGTTVDHPGRNCTPAAGKPPTDCNAYIDNSWWLPMAYVNNATCACNSTPNSTTANCVRAFLQARLAATPMALKLLAAAQKATELTNPALYQVFVQSFLTPLIYQDHVDAYASCCCSSGPAPYPAWIGVTTVPIPSCPLVGAFIDLFGSCHGTPGRW